MVQIEQHRYGSSMQQRTLCKFPAGGCDLELVNARVGSFALQAEGRKAAAIKIPSQPRFSARSDFNQRRCGVLSSICFPGINRLSACRASSKLQTPPSKPIRLLLCGRSRGQCCVCVCARMDLHIRMRKSVRPPKADQW